MTVEMLTLPALEIRQRPGRILYQFAVDGKLIDRFATVSRIGRSGETISGYQRPEALAHIASIRKYLESSNPMVPNSLVIAFDHRVRFEALGDESHGVRHGWINIPIDDDSPPEARPGWIVDGQQRSAAMRDANVEHFPLAVTAFITDDEEEQREQFILVNSAKPLSKSLIYELLPTTDTLLPNALARRRLSATLLTRLNYDKHSPFFQRVAMPTNPEGLIKDNSVLRMLDNSITDGVLYRFRDPVNGLGDIESMVSLVNHYWSAVAKVFYYAWDQPPRKSRLVHGVGIVSLGYLMDAIADRHPTHAMPEVDLFVEELSQLAPLCRWTAGYWQLGNGVQRKWNEFQNTSSDIQMLTNHLLALYRAIRGRSQTTTDQAAEAASNAS